MSKTLTHKEYSTGFQMDRGVYEREMAISRVACVALGWPRWRYWLWRRLFRSAVIAAIRDRDA